MNKKKVTEVLGLTLVVLTIFFMQYSAFRSFVPILSSDNAIYSILANRFLAGNFDQALHIWWQPFYPFLGSLFMFSGLKAPNALFFVSLVFGVLTFVPVFFLVRSITNNFFYAILAGFLTVFNQKLIASYFQVLTENLYIFILMMAMLFSYRFLSKKDYTSVALAGIFYALGYLTRSDILLLLQFFLGCILLLLITKKITLKKMLLSAGVLIATFILFISPYLSFNYQKFGYLNNSGKLNAALWMPGYFAPQNNLTTTYAQEVWSIDMPNYDSRYFNESFDFKKYGDTILQDTKTRTFQYFKIIKDHNTVFEITMFFIGFGMSFIYFWKKNRAALFLNSAVLINFFLPIFFQPASDLRYLLWVYPFVAIFWSIALFLLTKITILLMAKIKQQKLTFAAVLLVNLILVFFFYNLNRNNLQASFNKSPSNQDPYSIVGTYIKSISGPEPPRVMYRREAMSYYSGGIMIYPPTGIGEKELKDYAALWEADYLIADRYTFAPETPLGHLVDETKAPSWLKPIKIWDKEMIKTVLYRIEN